MAQSNIEYTSLYNIKPPCIANIFGVVKFSSDIRIAKTREYYRNISLVDDSIPLNEIDSKKIKCCIFSKVEPPVHAIIEGCLMRFHRLKFKFAQGAVRGENSSNGFAWAVFKNVPNSDFNPVAVSSITFSPLDDQSIRIVERLRNWYTSNDERILNESDEYKVAQGYELNNTKSAISESLKQGSNERETIGSVSTFKRPIIEKYIDQRNENANIGKTQRMVDMESLIIGVNGTTNILSENQVSDGHPHSSERRGETSQPIVEIKVNKGNRGEEADKPQRIQKQRMDDNPFNVDRISKEVSDSNAKHFIENKSEISMPAKSSSTVITSLDKRPQELIVLTMATASNNDAFLSRDRMNGSVGGQMQRITKLEVDASISNKEMSTDISIYPPLQHLADRNEATVARNKRCRDVVDFDEDANNKKSKKTACEKDIFVGTSIERHNCTVIEFDKELMAKDYQCLKCLLDLVPPFVAFTSVYLIEVVPCLQTPKHLIKLKCLKCEDFFLLPTNYNDNSFEFALKQKEYLFPAYIEGKYNCPRCSTATQLVGLEFVFMYRLIFHDKGKLLHCNMLEVERSRFLGVTCKEVLEEGESGRVERCFSFLHLLITANIRLYIAIQAFYTIRDSVAFRITGTRLNL